MVWTGSAIGEVNVHCVSPWEKIRLIVCPLHFIFCDNHLSASGNIRDMLVLLSLFGLGFVSSFFVFQHC